MTRLTPHVFETGLTFFSHPCMISCMPTKTISLELDAYEKLRRAKREGESFSAVVRRAYFGPGDARGASILGALEGLVVKAADRDALEGWETRGLPDRTVSPSHWGKEGDA
jgi:hypothetical protein